MKKCIDIKSLEDIKKYLDKEQILFFIDKAKEAMDAYELLIEIRDFCSDPIIAEEIFGKHIFVIYRSIFGKNNFDQKINIKIDNKIIFFDRPDDHLFSHEDIEEYDLFHKYIFSLVDQVYAHTDLNSRHKKVKVGKDCGFEYTKKIEEIITFDDITKAVNRLATLYSNLNRLSEEDRCEYYLTKYKDGGWVSFGYGK